MGCVTSVTGERICRRDIAGDNSPKKPSPFEDPIQAAINSSQLTLKTASKAEKELGYTDVFTYHSTTPIRKCAEVKELLGIPPNSSILNCPSNDAPLITATIEADKLQSLVDLKKLGW